ncbi:MAG TPA: hypothetical protein VGU01_09380 [Sphingomicrobium sp.]|nr:hypothetical protein [Sphingomicrobium sp.]
MSQSNSGPEQSEGRKALALLESALAILDAFGAPGIIGANVDLAICQLRELLGVDHANSDE